MTCFLVAPVQLLAAVPALRALAFHIVTAHPQRPPEFFGEWPRGPLARLISCGIVAVNQRSLDARKAAVCCLLEAHRQLTEQGLYQMRNDNGQDDAAYFFDACLNAIGLPQPRLNRRAANFLRGSTAAAAAPAPSEAPIAAEAAEAEAVVVPLELRGAKTKLFVVRGDAVLSPKGEGDPALDDAYRWVGEAAALEWVGVRGLREMRPPYFFFVGVRARPGLIDWLNAIKHVLLDIELLAPPTATIYVSNLLGVAEGLLRAHLVGFGAVRVVLCNSAGGAPCAFADFLTPAAAAAAIRNLNAHSFVINADGKCRRLIADFSRR